MNEISIAILLDCLEENLFEPNNRWPSDIFEERSYARWAAYEIWERILDHPYKSTDDIIDEFILDMELQILATDNEDKERMFRVAKETAEDILTLF